MRDVTCRIFFCTHINSVSTHTPHAGRDPERNTAALSNTMFLLTRPMRDVTRTYDLQLMRLAFLLTRPMRDVTINVPCQEVFGRVSTHTPHAGRDARKMELLKYISVSTHTPHAGRDARFCARYMANFGFYSHAPCGT